MLVIKMNQVLLLLLIMISSGASSDSVYKWTSEDGVVSYSDKPNKKAKAIELKPLQSLSWQSSPKVSIHNAQAQNQESGFYQSIKVLKPMPNEYVRSLDGNIDVVVTIEPELQIGHAFQAYIDGQPKGGLQTSKNFKLTDIYRGEHQLEIRIEDKNRQSFKSLEKPVTFFVDRNIILQNRPKAVREANGLAE